MKSWFKSYVNQMLCYSIGGSQTWGFSLEIWKPRRPCLHGYIQILCMYIQVLLRSLPSSRKFVYISRFHPNAWSSTILLHPSAQLYVLVRLQCRHAATVPSVAFSQRIQTCPQPLFITWACQQQCTGPTFTHRYSSWRSAPIESGMDPVMLSWIVFLDQQGEKQGMTRSSQLVVDAHDLRFMWQTFLHWNAHHDFLWGIGWACLHQRIKAAGLTIETYPSLESCSYNT